jgi:hypothetical protein
MRNINTERAALLLPTLRLTVSAGHLYFAAAKKLLCDATSALRPTISHLLNAADQTTSTRAVFVFCVRSALDTLRVRMRACP